ncbi:hypothetical protein BDN70DRAFT_710603 [Pholiota conissans]|uniref:Uncharacterized protein n=1 Tax=Pholiota conissans TaxID=109636 RepID=A0A9P6CKU3_9AGAR|nr:hypothetical protein BDN70DRAFT_710603 [Pholiota conissans]
MSTDECSIAIKRSLASFIARANSSSGSRSPTASYASLKRLRSAYDTHRRYISHFASVRRLASSFNMYRWLGHAHLFHSVSLLRSLYSVVVIVP